MKAAPQEVAHRPWPLPVGPWVMAQSWHDLLFAHWPVDAAELQLLLPPQLQIDALLVPDSTQLFLRPLSRACPLGYSLGIRCGNRLFVARGN